MDKEIDIVRAWKDEEYRNSLTPEQLAQVPADPAGEAELNEEDLGNVSGGMGYPYITNTCTAPKHCNTGRGVE